MTASPSPLHALPSHQRGLAAILLILLVGLSLTASVLGTMYYVHSEQDSSTTAHASTQAQMKAWNGAEAFRQYLYQAGLTGANALVTGNTIALSGINQVSGTVVSSAVVTSDATHAAKCTAVPGGTVQAALVTANFTGASGGATSTVQAVYCVASNTSTGGNTSALNFNHDTTLSGSITFNTSTTAGTSQNAVINVNGNFDASNLSVSGLHAVNATGNVTLGSNAQVDVVSSNGNVTLNGSASTTTINAMGNVVLTGSAYASGCTVANGCVNLSAIPPKLPANAINANGTVTAASTNNGAIVAIGDVTLGGATSVKTQGNVSLDWSSIGTVQAQKNLTVNSGSVGSGTIGGTLTKPSWNNNVNVTVQPGYTVAITPVTALTLQTQQIDAYQLQSLANYVFDIDSSGYRKVTVKSVNGITDGTYYLGNYDNVHQDYLCTALASGSSTGSPNCQTPPVGSAKTICQGYSTSNPCFSYNMGNGTWTINGNSIAPGVTWFHGNLNTGNGNYYNTFIATGNIATSGSDQVYAPNYAGFNGWVGGSNYTPTGVCVNSFFPSTYPINLCTPASNPTSYNYSNSAANYAFIAGGVVNGVYSGGNITLGSSNTIYGSVLAGNQLVTSGSTTVNGYVTSQGSASTVTNMLGSSTTINLVGLPPSYQPGAGLPGNGTGGPSSSATTVQVRWTRYL